MDNNEFSFEQLKNGTNDLMTEVKETKDPIDKIRLISDYIKKVLQSKGVKEVLLASPFGPDFTWDSYADGENYEGMTMLDYVNEYKEHSQEIEWLEPNWICYGPGFSDSPYGDFALYDYDDFDRTIVVRVGIVDGELRFTQQTLRQNEVGDLPDCPEGDSQLEPESIWLKPANMPDYIKWDIILSILLNQEEVWEYTAAYPELHRL